MKINKHNSLKGKMNTLFAAIAVGCSCAVATSCSDTWDEHYPDEPAVGKESLLQLIETRPELSNFLQVAKATHLYNNMHTTPVTYADLLGSDQALTVWAPIISDAERDSLLELCSTNKGDSLVGQQFVGNHIAHNIYNMNASTDASVKMFNDKLMSIDGNSFSDISVIDGQKNQPASNGLLHVINKNAPFAYNIYEGLTCLEEFSHIGAFLNNFEQQELDEDRSIVAGIEEGQKIYSDSVMIRKNILFRTLDNIISEDSTFAMLVPSREMWEKEVEEAGHYFNYANLNKGDSIQNYWTNISLLQDLIFNKNTQRSLQDSLTTTAYNNFDWPYHVYYKPLAEGGLLTSEFIKDTLKCSNGEIYRLKKWPFTKEQLYFHPVTTEAERESNISDYTLSTMNYRSVQADSVSSNGYLDIVPKNSTASWTATFKVRNHLSGWYDICAIILPKTVYNQFSRDFKPNKFTAVITYHDENGRTITENIKTEMVNDPYKVDTVKICTMYLPYSNYAQLDPIVNVQLKCSITTRQTQYSREMYLDCIYLKPSSEPESNAKARKEDDK